MPRSAPPRFLGHPLTPQPRPLDRGERGDAERRLAVNQSLTDNPDVLTYLVESHRYLAEIAHRSRTAHNRILWSGLAQLDSTGVWSNRAGDGVASGAIWIYSPTVPLIVAAGTRQSAPPNWGPGVFAVPANEELTLNAHAREWTLYGNGTAGGASIPVPQPAAGTNWSYTVPAGVTLSQISVSAFLTTSATGGTRQPMLIVTDPLGNIVGRFASSNVVASSAFDLYWGDGMLANTQAYANAWPVSPMTIGPGYTISAGGPYNGSSPLLAGDQWSQVVIGAVQTGGSPAQSAGALVNVTVYSDAQESPNR